MDYGNAWLNSIIDNSLVNDHLFWQKAFQQMENRARETAREMKGPFIFHGEIDCPEEMLHYPTVTMEQVQCAGKANWIEDQNGNFFTVDDATMEELFDNGKIIEGPYYIERPYDHLGTPDERVRYRVENQHITEHEARLIVGAELGHSLFAYTYTFEVIEIHDDEDHSEWKDVHHIEADSEAEAYQALDEFIRPVGFVTSEGYNFIEKRYTKTVVIKNIINLIDIKSNI